MARRSLVVLLGAVLVAGLASAVTASASAATSAATPSPAQAATATVSVATGTARPTAAASPVRPAATVDVVRVQAVTSVRGLVQPVAVTSANDGSGRLFVVERRGTVRVVRGGRLLAGFYLDLRRWVNDAGGEQGMLGLAFAPGFARRPWVFVTFTARDGSLVLARLIAARASAGAVSAATMRTVLAVSHRGAANHNGGSVLFNRDGLLYLGTGDGGGAGDTFDNARRLSSLNGKVLRIDVRRSCGGKRYCIPASNPFARTRGARPEIWLYGLRNPWRMSADAGTGDLWIGDVGQDRWEEVDRVRFGRGGYDLGWPCREGLQSYDRSRCGNRPRLNPVLVVCHPDSVAGCSDAVGGEALIGGYVYRGTVQPLLSGAYLFADFVTGNLWLHAARRTAVVGRAAGITAFGETERREPVAVTYAGTLVTFRATATRS